MHLNNIFEKIEKAGGTTYVVGGFCRDQLLDLTPKDEDYEVYGLQTEKLEEILLEFSTVDLVGKSFGIFKVRPHNDPEKVYDFSLPRTEIKQGSYHQDFSININPFLDPKLGAKRRDLTINSLMKNVLTGEILDFYGGRKDLENKVIRHTSEHFVEDPLRVLRIFQFCSRFNFTVAPSTINLCQSIKREYKNISLDRIWGEFEKWALSPFPMNGLKFLADCEWDKPYFQLTSLKPIKQSPQFHPEGSAYTHTLLCVEAAAVIAQREKLSREDTLILIFATLCHDFGKARCTNMSAYPKVTSYGHEIESVPLAESFLQMIGSPNWIFKQIAPIVRNHMAHIQCKSEKSIRKLAEKLEPSNMKMLVHLIEADYSGRIPLPRYQLPSNCKDMLRIAETEKVLYNKQKRIIEGRHLQDLGFKPGPSFGPIIKDCYEKQILGEFNTLEGGLDYVRKNFKQTN